MMLHCPIQFRALPHRRRKYFPRASIALLRASARNALDATSTIRVGNRDHPIRFAST